MEAGFVRDAVEMAHVEATDLPDLDRPLPGDPQAANVIALSLNG